MIKVEKAEIELSETTIRSLFNAIAEAKQTIDFTDEPMPAGEMLVYQYLEEQRRRGKISVSSPYSGISFKIHVETRPNSQESLGYKLDELEKPKLRPGETGRIVLDESSEEKKKNFPARPTILREE